MINLFPHFPRLGAPLALLTILSTATAHAGSCPEDCSDPAPPPAVSIYRHTAAGHLSPVTTGALPRVYVPNRSSNSVSVIDSVTLKEVDRFNVGSKPQHVVPSWDLKTLWVANNGTGKNGSLTPIDPMTAKPGEQVPVDDPYNLYFMPDGSAAIVVDEAMQQLDFRDPHSMALKSSLPTPTCPGINHADFSADGSYAIFTCEYGDGGLAKIDLKNQKVLGHLDLSKMGMPQDIRLSPDGKVFYVADMMNDGVFLIDGDSFREIGFIPTGIGTHGFVVSRDGKRLYVSNRGSHKMEQGKAKGPGSVTVIDFATRAVVAQWPIPGGGSPDMGNVSADGKQLWLSGRFDSEVYMIDTTSGAVTKIRVGIEPHGLTVWPQPGRYSQGHTGNMR
ncbi:YncE family protein [Mesorhizobium sp. M00.F.Ca.ET.149.01.1.1]|nr:YncE family protein [Mesorhizobium sp. M00.F.Ca.ET.149.01.1.1]